MHYSRIDLNLLTVFDAVMKERHISRAAILLGLTQPAVSHALKRLRTLLGDPLFIRSAGGMEPTPRAEAMAQDIGDLIATAERLLRRGETFVPEKSRRKFVIGMSDYASAVILPLLAACLEKEAPSVTLVVKNASYSTGIPLLDHGDVELVAGNFPAPPSHIREQLLYQEEFACACGEAALAGRKRLTLRQYTTMKHMQISTTARTDGMVDSALARLGERRRVTMTASHFLLAPLVLAESELIATEPRRLFSTSGKNNGIRVFKPPFAIPAFPVVSLWPTRLEADKGHQWLRQCLQYAATGRAMRPAVKMR